MSDRGPRIAFFSPLRPAPTGIADYSEELLPHLAAAGFRLELFVDQEEVDIEDSGESESASGFVIRRIRDFEWCDALDPYDLCLYQLGNHPLHRAQYRMMYEHPGLVVLHDVILHRGRVQSCIDSGELRWWRAELIASYGAGMRFKARMIQDGFGSHILFEEYPLLRPVLWSAAAVLVHNAHAAAVVRREDPEVPVFVAPSPLTIPADVDPEADPAEVRRELGLAADLELIVAAGLLTENKGLLPLLDAVAELASERPRLRLALVGAEHRGFPVRRHVAERGLEERVFLPGRVDRRRFHLWIQAADVCANLRYPTQGETSATLVRMMGLGKPVLVSDYRQYRELPAECVVRIPLGWGMTERLSAALRRLLADPAERERLGRAAREHARRAHAMSATVRGYAAAIREAIARRPRCRPLIAQRRVPGLRSERERTAEHILWRNRRLTAELPEVRGELEGILGELGLGSGSAPFLCGSGA